MSSKLIKEVMFGTIFACSFVGAGVGLVQGTSFSLDYVSNESYLSSLIITPAIIVSGAAIGTATGIVAGAVSPIATPIYIGYKYSQEQLK